MKPGINRLNLTYNESGKERKMKDKLINILRIFFPLIIGGIVGIIISNQIDYSNLVKPPLSPPKILFPIVWSIIYLLMGISYYLFRKENNNSDYDIKIYYIQLFINAMWSIIFFVWKARLLAVLWILLLVISVVALLQIFYQKKRISFWINIPYLIWLLFATYLTIGVYILN